MAAVWLPGFVVRDYANDGYVYAQSELPERTGVFIALGLVTWWGERGKRTVR